MAKLSPHFDSEEFTCRCGCGLNAVEPKLIDVLEVIRVFTDAPITIQSGRRCAKHNRAVGGAKSSQHLIGAAADIKIKGMEPFEVYDVILSLEKENKLF